MPSNSILVFSAYKISLVNLSDTVSVDEFLLNAYCSLDNILLLFICLESLAQIIYSRILDNEVKMGL